MPPSKKIQVDRADAQVVGFPEFYSEAEQGDAAANIRALLGDSVADLDQKRRHQFGEPVQANTEPAPEPDTLTETEIADAKIRDAQYKSDQALKKQNDKSKV